MPKKENRMMARRLLSAYLSSVISISLVLLLLGMATILLTGARSVTNSIRSHLQIEVFLERGVTEASAGQIAGVVGKIPGVSAVRLISESEGRDDLQMLLGDEFLDVFGEDVEIPLSYEVSIAPEYTCTDSLGKVGAQIEALPQVESVSYPAGLVDKMGRHLRTVSGVLLLLIAAALFISFVLIGNTVRINVFARRFTIHTMKQVGATKAFIRRPFMWNGLLQGCVSALLALLWGWLLCLLLRHEAPEAATLLLTRESLTMTVCVVFGAGILLCLLSTYLSVNRLLSMNKDQLYF